MTRLPLALTLLAALVLGTAACTPMADPATRLSTGNGECRFQPDTCTDLHRVRASTW
jgi:hypothetical protein